MDQLKSNAVVAVVVTYNRLEKLKVTVSRLLSEDTHTLKRLIVCDNASNDGTGAWLAMQNDPRLYILTLPENLGGAGGFEAGLRHAYTSGSEDWFLLMDDDAYPQRGTLQRFSNRDRSEAEVWLSLVRYPDGRICEMNKPWHNPFKSFSVFLRTLVQGRDAYHIDANAGQDGELVFVDGGSFVGQFVSRTAIRSSGFPRGELFIYAEDVLFTLAVCDAGHSIAYDASLLFVHDCDSFGEGAATLTPIWKVYFYYRNLSYVYRKVAGPFLFLPVMAVKYLAWRFQAKAYGPEKKTYIRLLNLAVRDAFAERNTSRAKDIQTFVNAPE